jgi:hypothetical protein
MKLKESLRCLTSHEIPVSRQQKPPNFEIANFIEEDDHGKRKAIMESLIKTKEKEVIDYILSDPKEKKLDTDKKGFNENYIIIEKEYSDKSSESNLLISKVKDNLKFHQELNSKFQKKNGEIQRIIKAFKRTQKADDKQDLLNQSDNDEEAAKNSESNTGSSKKYFDPWISAEISKKGNHKSKSLFKFSYYKKLLKKMIIKKRIKVFLIKCSIIELFYRIIYLRQFNENLVYKLAIDSSHKQIHRAVKVLHGLSELEVEFHRLQSINFEQKELHNFSKRFSFVKKYIERAYDLLAKTPESCNLISKARFVYRQINFNILSFLSVDEIKARFCTSNIEISFSQRQMILHEKMIRRSLVEDYFNKVNSKFKKNIAFFYERIIEFANKNRYQLRKISAQVGMVTSESLRASPISLAKKMYTLLSAYKEYPIRPLFTILLSDKYVY